MTLLLSLAILAQLPKVSPTDLGTWLVSAAAVGAIGLLGKNLLGKSEDPEGRTVTHAELGAALVHHPRREEVAELASRSDLVELDLSLRERDRGITEGVEEIRRQVAVLDHQVGHQGRVLEAVADKLGVGAHPGEERRTGR